jgi:hypothetical protein
MPEKFSFGSLALSLLADFLLDVKVSSGVGDSRLYFGDPILINYPMSLLTPRKGDCDCFFGVIFLFFDCFSTLFSFPCFLFFDKDPVAFLFTNKCYLIENNHTLLASIYKGLVLLHVKEDTVEGYLRQRSLQRLFLIR